VDSAANRVAVVRCMFLCRPLLELMSYGRNLTLFEQRAQ